MEPEVPSLVQFADQLTRVIIPILIVVGVVSNSLNIIVLTRPKLYKHACSRYFLVHSCSNLFYSSVLLVYRLLADQYHMDPAQISLALCKVIVFINHVGIFLTPNFIVLASIDRWCASSTNAEVRKFSNVKTARWMILFTTILFVLLLINSAITADLRHTDMFGCHIRADTAYKQTYVFVQACMMSLIPPCLMAIFGLMTIYNIKKARVLPITLLRCRRTGSQLAMMLLLQICTHLILIAPSSITYLIFVLPNDLKTTSAFLSASMLSVLPFHASYLTAFFLYILSAQVYRKELVRLGKRILRSNRRTRVYPMVAENGAVPTGNRFHP